MSLCHNKPILNILDLNDDAFQAILSLLSFDDIAKIRLVCRRFNSTGQILLKNGFAAVQHRLKQCQMKIKTKLPVRDSERRVHLLAQHIAVLNGMELCFFRLQLAYQNHSMDDSAIFFIHGKVLDEFNRLCRVVMTTQTRLISHELLDELEDLTSTACNHFKERIIPAMKSTKISAIIPTGIPASSSNYPISTPVFRMEDRLLIDSQRKQISELKSKVLEQEKLLNEHEQKWIRLEQHLGISLSQTPASLTALSNPHVAAPSTSSATNHQQSKRPPQDDEELRPSKRFQSQ